ncbi:MAG: GMC oxidoreductase, partial [Acidimicrobiales bacterium]
SPLQIMTDRRVARVLTAAGRATGVSFSDGTEASSSLIVVCAGAIRTPALLLASGLGSGAVGSGLKDHPSFVFTLGLRPRSVDEGRAGPPASSRAVSRLLRWSSDDSDRGDLQAFVIDRVDRPDRSGDVGPLAVVVVGLMRVSSIGSVTAGATVDSAPTVVTGALTTEDDRRRLRAGVRHVRQLLRRVELEPLVEQIFVDDIGTPADELDSMDDRALDRWIAQHPGPYAHPAASCAMGPDRSNAVVACEPHQAGRLRGCEGVHLADASIMPDLVQGGLQIPVTAVADRVSAALIAGRS